MFWVCEAQSCKARFPGLCKLVAIKRDRKDPCRVRSEPGEGFSPGLWTLEFGGHDPLEDGLGQAGSGSLRQVFDLLFRDITPDDYETLLRLDESVSRLRLKRPYHPYPTYPYLTSPVCFEAHRKRLLHQQLEEGVALRSCLA